MTRCARRPLEIEIRDLKVPADNLVGGEGNGFAMGQHRLAYGRLRHGMHNVAKAQRALDMAAAHVTKRSTFGQLLADRQAVQFMSPIAPANSTSAA
jgi:acyl-CoA dehydrogenase